MSAVCRYWAQAGKCFYGDQCNFTHVGPDEATRAAHAMSAPQLSQPQPQPQPRPHEATAAAAQGFVPKAQRYCRNLALHGFCKFEGAGCEFLHDRSAAPYQPQQPQGQEEQYGQAPQQQQQQQPQAQAPLLHGIAAPLSYASAGQGPQLYMREREEFAAPYAPPPQQQPPPFAPSYGQEYPPYTPGPEYYAPPLQDPAAGQYAYQQSQEAYLQEQVAVQQGGTTFFYEQEEVNMAPQDFNPYTAVLHQAALAPSGSRTLESFFMHPDVAEDLRSKAHATLEQLPLDDARRGELPAAVTCYHSLYPLDDPTKSARSAALGYPSAVYRATCTLDGLPYALRKIEGFRLTNEQALSMVAVWTNVHHSSVVPLREVFFSDAFGSNALYFVHDFYPCAQTVEEQYLSQQSGSALLGEDLLWSFVSQMVSALATLHRQGLASRVVHAAKILVTAKNRYRLGCTGVFDILRFDDGQNVRHFQQEDLMNLGKLVLSLACRSSAAVENIRESLTLVTESYSPALHDFIVLLVTKSDEYPTADQVSISIAPYLLREVEYLHQYTDVLEHSLSRESENGRLFRLLAKLGFINERPEHALDPTWSETGDRYLLKLYRDYVFHQVWEGGLPVVDFGHVLDSLNKLDAGVAEKLMLISRNEKSVLIVSYEDLKRSVEAAFGELLVAGQTLPSYD